MGVFILGEKIKAIKTDTNKILALVAAGTVAGTIGASQLTQHVQADVVNPTTQASVQNIDDQVNNAKTAKDAAQNAADQAQQQANASSDAAFDAHQQQKTASDAVNNAQNNVNSASNAVDKAKLLNPTSDDIANANSALTSAQGTVESAKTQLQNDQTSASAVY